MIGSNVEAYHYVIGNIITNWAALETRVASAIWKIGEIPDEIGACITSKILSLNSRVAALQAILHIRGFDEQARSLGKWLGSHADLQESRNRIAHDPVNIQDNDVYRLEIKARRTLTMGYQKVDRRTLSEVVDKIAEADDELTNILKPAIEAFPPLPRRTLKAKDVG